MTHSGGREGSVGRRMGITSWQVTMAGVYRVGLGSVGGASDEAAGGGPNGITMVVRSLSIAFGWCRTRSLSEYSPFVSRKSLIAKDLL